MSRKYENFLKKFINFCEKHKIWFSIDSDCLLAFMTNENIDEIEDHFQVFLDLKSFIKLKDMSLNNIVDSSIDSSYPNLTALWVENAQTWIGEDMAIRIRVAIPTTIKKIKKFNSINRRILLKLKKQPDNIKVAIDELTELKNFNGYLLLETRTSSISSLNWLQSLSFKRHWISYKSLKIPVLKEYSNVIYNWYGPDISIKEINET